MIKINSANKHMACNSCLSLEDVLSISIGAETSHTVSIRLCKNCRTKLMSKLICLYKKEEK